MKDLIITFFNLSEIQATLRSVLGGILSKLPVFQRRELPVEIFEKRLTPYGDLMNLSKEGSCNLGDKDSHQRFQIDEYSFRNKKNEMILLFGSDKAVCAYLDKFHSNAVDLLLAWHRLFHSNNPATGEERDCYWQQIKKLQRWFYDQHHDGARAVFSKHLALG